jgi:hypothetical protein
LEIADKKFVNRKKSGIALSRPFIMKQSLISLLWTSIEMNVARIRKKNIESTGKMHIGQQRRTIPEETHLHEYIINLVQRSFIKVILLDDCL